MKKLVFALIMLTIIVSCKKATTTLPEVEEEVSEAVTDSLTLEVDEAPAEKSTKQLKEELTTKGFKIFDYINEKTRDTILMQQYFMAFLKRGPIRTQNEEEAALIQKEHLAHLTRMYELGYADISGPFGDDGELRGLTIYNVPTLKMADSLAKLDPAVKAGWLEIEVRPWWAAKGFPLR
ncbi:YciI family protein [Seonamhaeicola aphaedonensis]|uniref:Uncharacterized protein YciI n=1 Tax=Seonamhaeicola aphaedonensis TaxID=1461338 RepID=A0A3D9HH81_9FLAO|nr:YciI family protein [Seonamhaeicola aphaedonensis]RED48735.1 uncharacterized protein YciI [Seonamhaeicola aphaedonensis]